MIKNTTQKVDSDFNINSEYFREARPMNVYRPERCRTIPPPQRRSLFVRGLIMLGIAAAMLVVLVVIKGAYVITPDDFWTPFGIVLMAATLCLYIGIFMVVIGAILSVMRLIGGKHD